MPASKVHNIPAPDVPYFTPAQVPASGTAVAPQPNGNPVPSLFQPIKIRGLEMQNRIVVSISPFENILSLLTGPTARPSLPVFGQGWLHDALALGPLCVDSAIGVDERY